MNATERNVENIVAIDLGKFNSAVCIFKKSTFKSNFRTIKTNGQDFHDLFVELEPNIVLFEAGSSAGWVADLFIRSVFGSKTSILKNQISISESLISCYFNHLSGWIICEIQAKVD